MCKNKNAIWKIKPFYGYYLCVLSLHILLIWCNVPPCLKQMNIEKPRVSCKVINARVQLIRWKLFLMCKILIASFQNSKMPENFKSFPQDYPPGPISIQTLNLNHHGICATCKAFPHQKHGYRIRPCCLAQRHHSCCLVLPHLFSPWFHTDRQTHEHLCQINCHCLS